MTVDEYHDYMHSKGFTQRHVYTLRVDYWHTNEEGYQELKSYHADGFTEREFCWGWYTAFSQTHNCRAYAIEDSYVWLPKDEELEISEGR